MYRLISAADVNRNLIGLIDDIIVGIVENCFVQLVLRIDVYYRNSLANKILSVFVVSVSKF